MIPTKTYPLSAIMGEETDDYERGYAQGCDEGKERIAELADAFNRVCDENADFVAQSVTDENRIAELEAQVKHCEGHAAELEAEVKALRESNVDLVNFLDEIFNAISIDKNVNARIRAAATTLKQQIQAAREGK
jgi:predicted nuclease with TOPRIM domain